MKTNFLFKIYKNNIKIKEEFEMKTKVKDFIKTHKKETVLTGVVGALTTLIISCGLILKKRK